MKSKAMLAAAVLPLLWLAGCQSADVDKEAKLRSREGKEFTAGLEGTIPTDEETKTFVDGDLYMYWTADDRLTIFTSTYNDQYRFEGQTGDNNGAFSKISSGQFVSGNPISTNYGVYPYNATTSMDKDEKISLVLPDTQNYAQNSFGLGANTMVAVTGGKDDYFLPFKNVCGYLVVRLYGEGAVKRIKIEGNNGEKISGSATVTASHTTDPVLAMAGTATESITLDCGEGVTVGATAETATEFWIVIPPVTFTQGFTVTIDDNNNGRMVQKTTASRTVQRNILTRMAPLQMVTSAPGEGTALLPKGQDFITAIKQIADPDAVYNTDVFITRISLNVNNPSTEGVVVSDTESEVPVYAVYDDVTGHLDINTAAAEICTGEEASYMFSYLFQCEAIDNLNVLNTSAATTMFSMFNNYTSDSLVNEKICMTSLDVTGLNTENVTVFTNMFNNCRKLTSIDVSNFNTSNAENMAYMFSRCESLESLDLSSFDTQNVVNFNYFLNHCESLTSLNISTLNTSSATTMQYMFQYCVSLPHVDLSSIDVTAVEGDGLKSMFNHCESMTSIDVNHFNLENATSLAYFMANMYGLESLDLSGLDTYNITDMQRIFTYQQSRTYIKLGGKFTTENCTTLYSMFNHNDAMVEFSADDLDTANCQSFQYMFAYCDVLQTLDLSNMDLSSATTLNYMFYAIPNLTEIRLGENFVHSKKPSNFFCTSTQEPSARTASNPGVLTIYCDQDQADWLATTLLRFLYWGYYGETMETAVIDGCPRITINFKDRDTGTDLSVEWDAPKVNYYVSTDYSLDGTTTTLQQSTNGSGIDIILMGDAFSDRQIADGTYVSIMQKAMEAFFIEEPYKSMRDRFNVYSVNVVSSTEGYIHGGQALNTGHGDGTHVYGNDTSVIGYAQKAIGDNRLDDALIIVIMNEDDYAGTCYMYYPSTGNYGRGLSIAYFPASSDSDVFNGLVSHEAGGHGFAKLADEYAYKSMGAISSEDITKRKALEPYGWWKNIDFTSDPSYVKWAQFISDERYASENIGCYEGGLTYWTGVWRPTENSILRLNTGGFNAPSRYAIWYRIGKLAYGEAWEGSYEDFVTYDQVNRTSATATKHKAQRTLVERQWPALAPPVVVGHSWREML